MVMPELAYQKEQFYPHGLKSVSKGALAYISLAHYDILCNIPPPLHASSNGVQQGQSLG